jgi:hypothetical protein
MFFPWLQPVYWLYVEGIQVILTQYTILHFVKVLSQKTSESGGWWILTFDIWHIHLILHIVFSISTIDHWRSQCGARFMAHPLHTYIHCIFHGQYMYASWEWWFLSDYYAPSQTHITKVVPSPEVIDVIPSMQLENLHHKNHTIFGNFTLVNHGIFLGTTTAVQVW